MHNELSCSVEANFYKLSLARSMLSVNNPKRWFWFGEDADRGPATKRSIHDIVLHKVLRYFCVADSWQEGADVVCG